MKELNLIAAMGNRGELGFENRLLCHLPKDLQRFKALTSGHTVLMGRKTWESLPKKPLPRRRNVVLSRNPGFHIEKGEVFADFETFVNTTRADEIVFVIGGAQLYQQFIHQADHLFITHILSDFRADAFFPPIDTRIWQCEEEILIPKDESNPFDCKFSSYAKTEK